MQVGEQGPGVVFARVRRPPGEGVEREHVQRVYVGAGVDALAAQLLGRDVGGRARPGAGARE